MDIPFEAIRRILEYLDDADEQEHYEESCEAFARDPEHLSLPPELRAACSADPRTNHVYVFMCGARNWLDSCGENKPSMEYDRRIAKLRLVMETAGRA